MAPVLTRKLAKQVLKELYLVIILYNYILSHLPQNMSLN